MRNPLIGRAERAVAVRRAAGFPCRVAAAARVVGPGQSQDRADVPDGCGAGLGRAAAAAGDALAGAVRPAGDPVCGVRDVLRDPVGAGPRDRAGGVLHPGALADEPGRRRHAGGRVVCG